ncbi:MAG TPA: response regulator [Candidatus Lokiarchaeia archaeon]|nr:response regulator [Candidatus Lokiarchaeia archaeon]
MKCHDILLVEDDPDQVTLLQEAFAEVKVSYILHVVQDGVDAMKYLLQEGEYGGTPRPDLILLDLNLPRKDGWEVLREVKSEDSLRAIPVIVFTSSADQSNINQCYTLGANCFITKPAKFEDLVKIADLIEHFWLGAVALPAPV